MSVFVLILELVGTSAFAVSGALLGIKKEMDIFGVCIMGVTTACGAVSCGIFCWEPCRR